MLQRGLLYTSLSCSRQGFRELSKTDYKSSISPLASITALLFICDPFCSRCRNLMS